VSFWTRFRSNRPGEVASTPSNSEASGAHPRDDDHHDEQVYSVAGERVIASIHGPRSLQSRISNLLAAGLMTVLALGFLAWYYTQAFAGRSRTQAEQTSKTKQQTQGEMALPPLGRVDPPIIEKVLGPLPELPPVSTFALDGLRTNEPPIHPAPSATAPFIPQNEGAMDRRLAGPAFVVASTGTTPPREQGVADSGYMDDDAIIRPDGAAVAPMTAGSLDSLLTPTRTPAVPAKVLPTQRLLLPKGAFVDCTLETAIDSSLPGMTTCVTATDTFGADGDVVLLERGTKLVGETRGDVRQGTARVYVLWTEARTPTGVVVPLASPGTDELGRAGLPGDVNRHFAERFGAAILVSVIDGAVQAAVQRSSSADGAVIVNPSTSRDVMTEVLRSTINIPPTVTKQHGDRIAVLVARDLDFRSVYELRPAALRR
jgi:type IV secretion system protein VirB10